MNMITYGASLHAQFFHLNIFIVVLTVNVVVVYVVLTLAKIFRAQVFQGCRRSECGVVLEVQDEELRLLGAIPGTDGAHELRRVCADPPHYATTAAALQSNQVSDEVAWGKNMMGRTFRVMLA